MLSRWVHVSPVYLDLTEELWLPTRLQVLQGLAPEVVLVVQHDAIGRSLAGISVPVMSMSHESGLGIIRLTILSKTGATTKARGRRDESDNIQNNFGLRQAAE